MAVLREDKFTFGHLNVLSPLGDAALYIRKRRRISTEGSKGNKGYPDWVTGMVVLREDKFTFGHLNVPSPLGDAALYIRKLRRI